MDDFDDLAAAQQAACGGWFPRARAATEATEGADHHPPPGRRGNRMTAADMLARIMGGLGDGLEGGCSDEEECDGDDGGGSGGSDDGGSGKGGSDDGSDADQNAHASDHGDDDDERGGANSSGDGSGRGGGSEAGFDDDDDDDDQDGGAGSDAGDWDDGVFVRRGGGGGGGGGDGLGGAEDDDRGALLDADWDIDSSTVLARLEAFAGDAIAAAAGGALPELELVSRGLGNVHLVADDEGDGAGGGGGSQATAGAAAAAPGARVRLGARAARKSLTHAQGRQAATVARIFRVLGVVHELLRARRQVTLRDLYYKLHEDSTLFPTAAAVSSALADAAALLRVPRAALCVACAPRGAAAGRICVRDAANGGAWIDCARLGAAGMSVPGDLAAVERLSFRVDARAIIVVEKDAIFQRLAAGGGVLGGRLPVALVTARGHPDLATRAFLARLCAAAPTLPVLGLVDWNPAGARILATYARGSARLGLEGTRYAVPRLRWLGVTSAMLDNDSGCAPPPGAMHALTPRDAALLPGLRAALAGEPSWLAELDEMERRGLKCDIEALDAAVGGVGGLGDALARRIVRGQYL